MAFRKVGRYVFLGSVVFSASCSPQDESARNTARAFWDAAMEQDEAKLASLVSNQRGLIPWIEGEVTDERPAFKIGNVTRDNDKVSVSVRFTRYCYDETVFPTLLVEHNDGLRVDGMATFHAMAKAAASQKPNKKYCYEISQQPLSGVLNGQPWSAHHVQFASFDFGGGRKEERISIVSEPCLDPICSNSQKSSLVLNVGIDGDGGNFDARNNITLFTPPGSNQIITRGSYRIVQTNGQRTLGIRFHENRQNYVDGFIPLESNGRAK